MVDPIGDEERASFTRKLKLGVTVLVGLSAGLVAAQADASLTESAGAVALGFAVGYVLARYAVPSGPAPATRQRQRRERQRDTTVENPFADGGDLGSDDGDRGVGDGDHGADGGIGDDASERAADRSNGRSDR
jgi:hypothetical protein